VYQAFDLLHLDGRSLLDVPLEQRKRLLELVLRPTARVRYAAHVDTEGIAFFEAAAAQGLEGIVAKQRRSRYEPGRRVTTWLKLKARPEQELVVGGWTPGEGTAKDLGAVAVGVYEGERLRFAGKVGSGFDARARRDLRARLDALEVDVPPFDPAPAPDYRGRWGGDLAGVRWVRPELVIRAELGGWTRTDTSVRPRTRASSLAATRARWCASGRWTLRRRIAMRRSHSLPVRRLRLQRRRPQDPCR
jgi:bifunctional non-homologous end joining protein LigD